MLNKELIDPKSIVVVGGCNDLSKPRGKVLKNIIDGGYRGKLYVTNTKEAVVQGLNAYADLAHLPEVDLAVVAIPAAFVPEAVEYLAKEKNTKAFIVISAGFGEENEEGKLLEKRLAEIVNKAGATLIGPNCTGIITPYHHSVFADPIPKVTNKGCDFISASGAAACFFLEYAIPRGLAFSGIYSVGNSAQTGVEEMLKHMDETFDPEESPKVKLLYLENIKKPGLLLKHASSLISKGCRIAAIKAGYSEAGSRAASSHTGALASSDVAVDALLKKAGIVRCLGRDELLCVGSVFMHKELKGNKICIITHAGGPAVVLTDVLSTSNMSVPKLDETARKAILKLLFPGASANNPVDILATGTAEQLAAVIDYVDTRCDNIDAIIVIYGTPGLFKIYGALDVLDEKIRSCKKPLYAVMPSVVTAADELKNFIAKGRINFPDVVTLGQCLSKIYYTRKPAPVEIHLPKENVKKIRSIIDQAANGYLAPADIGNLLDAAGIARIKEVVVYKKEMLRKALDKVGMPVVMKVVGPLHKTDVGGVVLNIHDHKEAAGEFTRMMKINGAKGVMIQPRLNGVELFAGAKLEDNFGHVVLCGLGGIFVEVLKDINAGLAPLTKTEALSMIRTLKGYKIFQGARGRQKVDEKHFAEIIVRLSALLKHAPEIMEMDLNPLIASGDDIVVVDARINIYKELKEEQKTAGKKKNARRISSC